MRRLALSTIVCAAAAGCLLSIDDLPPATGAADAATDAVRPETDGAVSPEAGRDADADAEAAAPLDPDLVAWWPLDEGQGTAARDSTANHNDGVLGAGATWSAGKHGSAVAFDGDAGRIFVANNSSQQTFTSALTFAAWLWVDSTSPITGRILQLEGTIESKLNGSNPQITSGSRYAIMDWAAPIGEWHHIAFVVDSSAAKAYVDGASVALGTNAWSAGALPTDTQGISLGGVLPGQTDPNCTCRLDDVRLYRRALGAAEIAALAK